jgi:ABC-2 type transport system permease protein
VVERGATLGLPRVAVAFARLKWHLLRGGLRGSTQQRVQTVLAAVVALVFGLLAAFVLFSIGREAVAADDIVVVLLPVSVLAMGVLSAATGVEATVDPRHLAGEPLTRSELGVGMLVSAAVGPAAILALLAGVGLAAGWGGAGPVGGAVLITAVLAWWATLLLFSRTTANLLGAVASGRFRQVAQLVASGSALAIWFAAQILVRHTRGWDAARWEMLADVAARTPPGQIARAVTALDRPGAALVHLLLGVSWLPALAWASVASTHRLAFAAPRPGSGLPRAAHRPAGLRSGPLRLLPTGPVAAMTARTLTTKLRTPRQSVNTVTALLVGAGIFFVGPLLDGGTPDPRVVLVGGLLHFAVLFDGNNAYGMDGPAIWLEVTSGADAAVLIRGKVAASMLVMGLPALVLPVAMASMSGGWRWLPAAWLIAAGSLLAASGVSVANASLAPVALPDSPNPLAAGDTGQGCAAGAILGIGTLVLAVVSAPVAALVVVATWSGVLPATAAALSAPVVGALVLWGGMAVARSRIKGQEAELVQKVTPAR